MFIEKQVQLNNGVLTLIIDRSIKDETIYEIWKFNNEEIYLVNEYTNPELLEELRKARKDGCELFYNSKKEVKHRIVIPVVAELRAKAWRIYRKKAGLNTSIFETIVDIVL